MKFIKLSRGYVATVDDEDYVVLMRYKWTAANCPTNLNFYAHRNALNADSTSRTTIKMHRQIMNCPKGLQVDHINGKTLNLGAFKTIEEAANAYNTGL